MTFAETFSTSEPLKRPITRTADPKRSITLPSAGAGPVATDLQRLLEVWKTGEAQLPLVNLAKSKSPDFSQSARDTRRFEMKTYIATVAMHLEPNWRLSLFDQIDNLLDVGDEEWEAEHDLPSLASWQTFIRLVIHYKFRTRPSLTLFEGNISATWMHDDIRLTIEAMSHDAINWVASRDLRGTKHLSEMPEREAVAGETTLKRLSAFLTPFDANDWLLNG